MKKTRKIYEWIRRNFWPSLLSAVFSIVFIVMIYFINSPNPSTQSLADAYANLGVAFGTIVLATVTFAASSDSRRSIVAQEVSAERMKDTLRPLIDMDVFYQASVNPIGLFLIVRNVGVGPATIRLLTGRNDVGTDCFRNAVPQWKTEDITTETYYRGQAPIVNMVLGPSEAKVLCLGTNHEFTVVGGTWVSSLSVFYEDVYGRYYRTRLVYQRDKDSARVIGKESFDLSEMPFSPWQIHDIQGFRTPEGTPYPVEYRSSTTPLHFTKHAAEMKAIPVAGTDFTRNKALQIKDISFDRHNGGFPTWEIQIGQYINFKLKRTDNGVDSPATFSLDPKLPYRDFGLNSSGRPENDIQCLEGLYNHILNEVTN